MIPWGGGVGLVVLGLFGVGWMLFQIARRALAFRIQRRPPFPVAPAKQES